MQRNNVKTAKVALVTGASSGIGMKTAQMLQLEGWSVWCAARSLDKMESLKQKGMHTLFLDLTDEGSAEKCVRTVWETEGRIDVLVNNAGYGQYGPVETVDISEARRQLEVNLLGLAKMVQLVMPIMRQQNSGRIINVSSMAGKMYTRFGAWYHASKFALEGFSDCLRVEAKQWGVKVILIEPGCIKTPWNDIACDHLEECTQGTPYQKAAAKTASTMRKLYAMPLASQPDLIAKIIVRAATRRNPRTRFLVGFLAKPAVLMRRLLPDRLLDWVLLKIEG